MHVYLRLKSRKMSSNIPTTTPTPLPDQEADPGMNDRIRRLRKRSVETEASISIERAFIETQFYRENYGKYSIPVLRALTL